MARLSLILASGKKYIARKIYITIGLVYHPFLMGSFELENCVEREYLFSLVGIIIEMLFLNKSNFNCPELAESFCESSKTS